MARLRNMLARTSRGLVTLAGLFAAPVLAQELATDANKPDYATDTTVEEVNEALADIDEASSVEVRRFHEVLNELLTEFGYDVKTGQLKGLKNLAIRRVEVSDAIPRSYRKYMDALVTERIIENSQVKLISCVPCRNKATKMIDGKLVITSPTTNHSQLTLAAERLGVENFMDVILVYHSTHMVLAFQIFNAADSELLWSRSYNSETIRSRYQKLAIDYKQIEKSRPSDTYEPEYRLLIGLGGAGIPNVAGDTRDSSMLSLMLRSTEKFDNRRSEFGMIFNLYVTLASIVSEYPKLEGTGSDEDTSTESDEIPSASPAPYSNAIALYGLYAHNFVGAVESYDRVRQGLGLGLGAMLATGYLAPAARLGWDIYFGRRWAVNTGVVYIAASEILVGSTAIPTNGGVGGELIVSFNY